MIKNGVEDQGNFYVLLPLPFLHVFLRDSKRISSIFTHIEGQACLKYLLHTNQISIWFSEFPLYTF